MVAIKDWQKINGLMILDRKILKFYQVCLAKYIKLNHILTESAPLLKALVHWKG